MYLPVCALWRSAEKNLYVHSRKCPHPFRNEPFVEEVLCDLCIMKHIFLYIYVLKSFTRHNEKKVSDTENSVANSLKVTPKDCKL